MSQKAGIPRSTLETYLTGKAEPKASRLVAIADAAGVSVEWLATGRGAMRPEALQVAAPVAVARIDEELLEAALVATIYSLAVEDGAKDLAKKPSAIAKFTRLASVG